MSEEGGDLVTPVRLLHEPRNPAPLLSAYYLQRGRTGYFSYLRDPPWVDSGRFQQAAIGRSLLNVNDKLPSTAVTTG